MKTFEMYQCEKCGQKFAIRREAERCEELHLTLEKSKIVFDYDSSHIFPRSIRVYNGDAFEVFYRR